MKRISKRLLSLVLALMMVATLLPMGAIQVFADDITWTEVDTFDEFTAAVAAGGNIRLMADITSTAKVVITTTVVIDFNSFTYTSYNGAFDSFYIQGGTVTMKDLSETKDGGIYLVSSKDSAYQMIRNSGKLTIENGVYTMDNNHTSAPYVIYSWGTCIINGGTFTINCTSSGSGYVLNNTAKGKTTINGGSFYANGSGSGSVRTLYNQANDANGTLTVNGGTYTVKATGSGIAYGMTNGNYGKMYVNGGTISVTQEGTPVPTPKAMNWLLRAVTFPSLLLRLPTASLLPAAPTSICLSLPMQIPLPSMPPPQPTALTASRTRVLRPSPPINCPSQLPPKSTPPRTNMPMAFGTVVR